jgi:hypothetical protein
MAEHPFNRDWRIVITKFQDGNRTEGDFHLKISEAGDLLEGSFTDKTGGSFMLEANKITTHELHLKFKDSPETRFHGFLSPELSSGSIKVVCGIFVVGSIEFDRETPGRRPTLLDGQNDGTWTGTQP